MKDYKKLNLVKGWNLVSSFDLNVNLDDIKKPDGLTIQAVYEYNSGYNSVNEYGKGYWMKADMEIFLFLKLTLVINMIYLLLQLLPSINSL